MPSGLKTMLFVESSAVISQLAAFAFRVVLEILRHRAPAPDVVPIERRLDHQHAIGFFHDRVVEGNFRQLA